MAAMGRALLLFVVLYVGLDLSNPMIEGAFRFDPGDSIEGVRAERVRDDAASVAAIPAPDRVTVDPAPAPPMLRQQASVGPIVALRQHVRRSPRSPGDRDHAPSPEDH
jgi:hypothetical protein